MLGNGNVAVAIVQRQVMVVQATRSHKRRDKYLDVHTYAPFGDRVFLSSPVPNARIVPSDILTIFPSTDQVYVPEEGMLELPQQAFSEFMELNSRHQKRCESMWSAWTISH
ncbi:hypothetical protein J132_04584 [Termitomyces sp. J132]|nr:hypothetical protein H2248_010843 [Termitomyces sp. 'cryptogamus']KNZ75099.1 hypothetical protein J132_04584 [Termitomyces sp. J132]